MEQPVTVADAVRGLEALGYTADIRLDGPSVRCEACHSTHEPDRLVITHTFRFEGASDPDDEAVVFGIECPDCGERGIVVSAFGPQAEPALFEILQRLTD